MKLTQTIQSKIKSLSIFDWVLIAMTIVFFSIFFSRQINMINSDLGRHIENGKMLLDNQTGVLNTNYYSYTQTEKETINHHWLSGLIFYLVQKNTGFTGLSIFYTAISVLTCLFFMLSARLYSTSKSIFFLAFLASPFLASRTEIRPEGFSYLFLGVSLFLYLLFFQKKINFKYLIISIVLIQLFWINCHIFFFLGFMMMVFFFIAEYLNNKDALVLKQFAILASVSLVISLLNPNFIKGLLVPLTIFEEYGYLISENQSVFFMLEKGPSPLLSYFEIFTFLLFILLFVKTIITGVKNHLALSLCFIAFSIIAFKAIRGIPLVGYISIPLGVLILETLNKNEKLVNHKTLNIIFGAICILIFVLGIENGYSTIEKNKTEVYQEPSLFSPLKTTTGIGLIPNLDKSSEFFKKNHLKGPIFNNYDIGGYLIYYLDGKEKVYVDNRPEAYTNNFFQKEYMPMQEDSVLFKKLEAKYKFNCIWFFMMEDAPWSKKFLLKTMRGKDFAPVFCDGVAIIFLKRNNQNEALIKKFEIPKSMFGVVQ
jgi:hypothetical protein